VRASRLDETLSEGCLPGSVARRHVALPGSPVGEPFVDADDIADVVVAVLTDDGHARRIYEATGPRESSFAEAVEQLAEATGRRIRYMRASTERDAALLAGQDVPEEVVVRLRRVIDKVIDGRDGTADPGVERAIGREPHDVGDHARPAASTRKPATATDGRPRDRTATRRRASATPQPAPRIIDCRDSDRCA
jgi:uncharacterized protein YbjT (DUF2867 family)